MHLLESAETCACEWHGCQTASGMLMSFIVAVCGVNQVTTEQKEQREREATTNERKKKLKGCRICVPAATSDFSWQRQEASGDLSNDDASDNNENSNYVYHIGSDHSHQSPSMSENRSQSESTHDTNVSLRKVLSLLD
jgi:hypothetical protein